VDFPAEGDYISASPEETARFAERLAPRLGPGSVVGLAGTLGAGKTVFAGGLARGMGIGEEVRSPTYTIINEYGGEGPGTLPLYHMDAYRLSGDDDFRLAGGEELLYGKGICVIEWPERLGLLPRDLVSVTISIMEDGRRLIRYRTGGSSGDCTGP
jgi:tRNA threonylcarbamoyladenosine biosynthesis protein TsaE